MNIAMDEFISNDYEDYVYDIDSLPIMPTKKSRYTFAEVKENLKSIPERKIIGSWDIRSLDKVYDGIKPATVALIGAGSGVGKTTLSLYFMKAFYKQNLRPLYLSTEMQIEDLRDKCPTIFDECPNAGFEFITGIPSVRSLTETVKDIAADGYDAILLDYINSGALSNEGYEHILPDQLICMLLESVRAALGKIFQEKGKAPMVIVFTQLNRNYLEGSDFPDARVLQGSMSAANKCDYAVNFVKDRGYLCQKGHLIGWVYKNRWGMSDQAVLLHLDYEAIEIDDDDVVLSFENTDEDVLLERFIKKKKKKGKGN